MRCFPFLAAVLLGLTGFATSLQGQAATELSRVPANAALVVHFQAGTLYASPAMKDLRALLAKAGPRGLEVFEDLFQPDSIQLDRITGVVMSPSFNGGKSNLAFAFIVTTRADIHPDHFAGRLSDVAVPVTSAAIPTWVDKRQAITFALPEPRLCILGTRELVDQLALAPKTGKVPPVFEGLDPFHFAVVANIKALPPRLGEFLPTPLGPIAKASTIRATVMLKQPAKIDLQMNYNSEKDAVLAEDAVRDLARLARGEMEKSRFSMLAWGKETGAAPNAGHAETPKSWVGSWG